MLTRAKALARLALDSVILFVCLIGAAEIRTFACTADDGYKEALDNVRHTQENEDVVLERAYRKPKIITKAVEPIDAHENIIRTFFECAQKSPHRTFVICYFSVATILAFDGLLSMRMSNYLQDQPLFFLGSFELISGTILLSIPFLALYMRRCFDKTVNMLKFT